MGNENIECVGCGATIAADDAKCAYCGRVYYQDISIPAPSHITENLTEQTNKVAAYFSSNTSLKWFKGFFYFGILGLVVGFFELFNDLTAGLNLFIPYLIWVAIFYFLITMKQNKIGTEQEIDEMNQLIVNQVFKKLSTEKLLEQAGEMLYEPVHLYDYDLDKKNRLRIIKGKDGRIRTSQYKLASIQFYQEHLSIYTYHFSLLKNDRSESFIHVPYREITTVTSVVQEYTHMDWRGKKQEIPIEQLLIQGEDQNFLEMTLQGDSIGQSVTKINRMIHSEK